MPPHAHVPSRLRFPNCGTQPMGSIRSRAQLVRLDQSTRRACATINDARHQLNITLDESQPAELPVCQKELAFARAHALRHLVPWRIIHPHDGASR
jgi:uncharacterized NAD(P)/FAD-binding protein YdhS